MRVYVSESIISSEVYRRVHDCSTLCFFFFFFSSRRRHTRSDRDWSSDVCSSDLERIQVGLLNIMEERDVQIRGYRVRLPLDIFMVASANPEDYTNRGRIITPLKDRCGSEIRTHYPSTHEHEISIMEQESTAYEDGELEISAPTYVKEILAEFTHLARKNPDISQRSGVSVRVSICNYENVISNAVRRAIRLREKQV